MMEDSRDWSPILVLAPLQLAAALSMDFVVLFVGLAAMTLCAWINISLNTATWFQRARHASIPVRIVYVITIMVRMASPQEDPQGSGLAVVGYVLALVMALVDVVWIDGAHFVGRRDGTSIEVLHELKNQVFVCMWRGPPYLNSRYTLLEQVCGVSPDEQLRKQSRIMLVAVVQGIVCELVPVSVDVGDALQDATTTQEGGGKDYALPFCGLDVYDDFFYSAKRLMLTDGPAAHGLQDVPERTSLPVRDDSMPSRKAALHKDSGEPSWVDTNVLRVEDF